jgi:hypothetical protein
MKLKSATKRVAVGATVKLRLPLNATARRRIASALRVGRKVTVKLKVVATDAAGNVTTRTRTITIRR